MVFGQVKELYIAAQAKNFQFPVGIRWCSDKKRLPSMLRTQKSFNSLWELDGVRTITISYGAPTRAARFQFPVGIRWCSDVGIS